MGRHGTATCTEAGLYLRLSKDRPDQTSTTRQRSESEEWASRNGVQIVEVFTDLVSGYRANVARPQFDAALDWVTAAPGRTLVAWKLDRLSRRGIGQVGTLLDRLEEVGGRVVFVKDGLDSSTAGHRMAIALVAEQARSESENTSTRTKSALARRKQEGRWSGGQPPYGFRITTPALRPGNDERSFVVDPAAEPGRLVIDPETGPVLRKIVDQVIAGASLYEVARWLDTEGHPAPRGGRWRVPTLATMLRSPVLLGWLPSEKGATTPIRDRSTKEPVVVGEALISRGDHRRLIQALERRTMTDRFGRRRGAGRKARALLTGIIRCGVCDSAMSGSGTAGNLRYACTLRAAGGNCEGNTVTMPGADEYVAHRATARWAAMDPADPVLLEVAAILLGRPTVDPRAGAERAAIEDEVAELQARLDDLVSLRLEPEFRGPDGKARYAKLRDPLMAAIRHAEAALADVKLTEPDVGVLLDPVELREGWQAIDTDAKRAALAATIGRIDVRKAARRGMRFDPDARLGIIWRDSASAGELRSA